MLFRLSLIIFISFLQTSLVRAQEEALPTVMEKESTPAPPADPGDPSDPDFDYGPGESQFKWGVEVPLTVDEKSDFKLRVGTRLQANMLSSESIPGSGAPSSYSQDSYIRRARLQVGARFRKNLSFYMDIRADKVEKGNAGDNGFALGDAFLQVKNLFGSKHLKMRFFRAKFDVSRSQTVSSSRLLHMHRAVISDFAADYISNARRGSNVQFLLNWNSKIHGQLVFGDSVSETSFKDALGTKITKVGGINNQTFAYGARIRVSPFDGWEDKKLKETYFGEGQHFTIGAGYYGVNNINFNTPNLSGAETDRQLLNYEMSFHYGPFSLSGEYFVFDGLIEDYGAPTINQVMSNGGFAQAEFVFKNFHYLSPYVRYQFWNRVNGKKDYDETRLLMGLNYYLKGNKFRLGVYHEQTDFGAGLVAAGGFPERNLETGLTFMMHY